MFHGVKEIKILFDPQVHGWRPYDFHRICDNHPNPTFTVIKSDYEKIFGGFTKDIWNSYNRESSDKDSFIFSLD